MTMLSGPGGRQRLLGIGVLVLTFLVGAFSGAAIQQVVAARDDTAATEPRRDGGRDGGPGRERGMFPYRALGLSDEQRAQVDAVLQRRTADLDAFWKEHRPELDAIVDSARAEIRRLLTPEQREKYDEMRRRRMEQHRRQAEQHERNEQRSGPDRGGR
jgi:Spy/CpxP family protein refolding chaperone